MMCFISAFFYTSIANVSFVYGAMPLVTMLLAWVVLRDPVTSVGIIAIILSGLGAGVLVWGGQHFGDFLGLGLAFLMTFFMATVTVAAKFFPDSDAMKSAYLSGFIAALLVFPFSQSGSASSTDLVWLALYGLVNVGLGFGVYLLGVSRISALAAALIGLSEVPLAPIWAFVLFDEKISFHMIAGGCLIVTASVIYILACHPNAPEEKT
jgi:drug/metabolite transporter (DMT)-like permease